MDETLNDSADALLRTYSASGGINYLDAAATLPSRPAIDAACVELLSLLFPGFHGEPVVRPGDLPELTRSRIRALRARLHPEMCKSLARREGNGAIEPEADRILADFFSKLAEVREMLWTDLDAAYEGDPAATSFEEIILAYPSLEAIAIQRMAHILYLADLPLIPRMMTEWAHGRTGIDIHPGAQIGSHFFIDHGTGVVIGETTKIGSHVKLYQGVSFIARSLSAGRALRGQKASSDGRGSCRDLCRHDRDGRRYGGRRRLHHRSERFPHPQRAAAFSRLLSGKRDRHRPEAASRGPRQRGRFFSEMIYLDYNATTPLCAAAWRAMQPYFEEQFGNPSSVHRAGRETRAAVDDARDRLAASARRKTARNHFHERRHGIEQPRAARARPAPSRLTESI